jgi:pimeloyl-[acyl-carrier protein] methyl ester esterase
MKREVVLLNGWSMTRAAWRPLVSALPADWTVHAIDLQDLGSGASADLAAAIARRAPRACDVIAWSLGAQLALQWMHDRPDQVRRAALIAATPCFVARADWPAGMDPAVFEAFAAQVGAQPVAALQRFALLQARGDANMHAVARELRGALCDAGAAEAALQAGLACLRGSDLRAAAGRVRAPVLLAHGAQDAIVPVAAAMRLAAMLTGSRLEVYGETGHAPHLSRPAALAAAIAGHFS